MNTIFLFFYSTLNTMRKSRKRVWKMIFSVCYFQYRGLGVSISRPLIDLNYNNNTSSDRNCNNTLLLLLLLFRLHSYVVFPLFPTLPSKYDINQKILLKNSSNLLFWAKDTLLCAKEFPQTPKKIDVWPLLKICKTVLWTHFVFQ